MKFIKPILTILSLLLLIAANAQTPVTPAPKGGWIKANSSYGTIQDRSSVGKVFLFPTACGTPAELYGTDLGQAALFYDSCGNTLYKYSPSLHAWSAVGGGGSTLPYNGDTTFYLAGDSILHQFVELKVYDTCCGTSHISNDTLFVVSNNSSIVAQDGLVTPGYVTWSGSGLTYDVTSATYIINSITYISGAASVTLDVADPDNPRIDVIAVDTNGNVVAIAGDPATNPSEPQVDPGSQVLLTSIFVPAGAIVPVVTQTIVYDENTENFTGAATGITLDLDNTSNPYHLTKSADVGSWTSQKGIIFSQTTGTTDASNYSMLKMFIYLKAAIPSGNFRISFFNNETLVSNTLTIGAGVGFTKTLAGAYQNITVPFSSFHFTNNTFNKIKITVTGTGSGAYIDYIQLQGGIYPPPTENPFPTSYSKNASHDSTILLLSNGTRYAVKDSVGVGTDTTSLSNRINQKLNITDTSIIHAQIVQIRSQQSINTDSITAHNTRILNEATARSNADIASVAVTGTTTKTVTLTKNDASTITTTFTDQTGGGGSSLDTVNVANVLSFGADSTGATDATAAINNAIRNNQGKKRVYLPHGTYKVTVTHVAGADSTNKKGIELLSGIELFGDGPELTKIRIDTTGAGITFSFPSFATNGKYYPIINMRSGQSNVKIHDLSINGRRTKQNNYRSDPYLNSWQDYKQIVGIMLYGGYGNYIYNVKIDSLQGQGIYDADSATLITKARITTCGFNGVQFQGATKSSALTHSVLTRNNSDNVFIGDGTDGVIVEDNEISWAKTAEATATYSFAGVYLSNGWKNAIIKNNYIHDNSAYGIDMNPTSTPAENTLISGNIIKSNGNAGANIGAIATIIGNQFIDNSKKTDSVSDNKSGPFHYGMLVGSTGIKTILSNQFIDNYGYQSAAIAPTSMGSYIIGSLVGNTMKSAYATNYFTAFGGTQYTMSAAGNNLIAPNIPNQAQLQINRWRLLESNSGSDTLFFQTSVASPSSPLALTPTNIILTNGTPSTPKMVLSQYYNGASHINSLTVQALESDFYGTGLELYPKGDLAGFGSYIRLQGNNTTGTGLAMVSGNAGVSKQMIVSDYAGTGGATFPLVLGTASGVWFNGYKQQLTLFPSGNTVIQNSTSAATDAASALLSLNSTTQGALLPRMTGAQMTAISSPATGLLVWCTDSTGLCQYTGSAWVKFAASASYTFSTGLTNTSSTITNNLSTGVSGGQSVIGGTASGNNLTLSSTSNGTKGKIIFGSASAYDEVNDRIGIGTTSPGAKLDLSASYNVSNYTIRTGDFILQPNAHNNGFIQDNAYYNGSSWTKIGSGYSSGFQFYNGQVIMNCSNTGSGSFTQVVPFKLDFSNSGSVALGGGISGNVSGTYTGAAMVVLGTGAVMINTTTPNNSTLQVAGSLSTGYVSVTNTYSVLATDHTINCSGSFTVTLPTAASITGREYTIVNSGSNTVTIATTSSQTFTNITSTPTTLTLSPVGAAAIVAYTVVSNGANWIVTGKVKNE